MFGISSWRRRAVLETDENRLLSLLDRRSSIDPLKALVSAMGSTSAKRDTRLSEIAIGLDSSVFLRLGQRAGADIVDYLDAEHPAPIILPGQAIQEFWNNQLSVVDTISTSLKKKYDALRSELVKVDNNFGDFCARMERLLDDFEAQYGFIYDESTKRTAVKLLETLQRKAIVPYVSRSIFHDVAANRKRTRTPPGFEDNRDGDFFIWADFLSGLLQSKAQGRQFSHAIIVTHDKKIDWSRAGTAHPVLVAEVSALVDVSFELWDIQRLTSAIEGR